jgi:hypothetical protein
MIKLLLAALVFAPNLGFGIAFAMFAFAAVFAVGMVAIVIAPPRRWWR